MKIKLISAVVALAFFIGACGSAPVTATSPAIQIIPSATEVVVPTVTLEAPTQTATETPLPTNTPEVLPTLALTDTPVPIVLATSTATNPCNQPLVSWRSPTATLTIYNETNPPAQKILLLVSVATKLGECGWLKIYGDTFSGPVGTYSATAYVEGKKNFKVSGSFWINYEGSWKIVVRNDAIVALGGCYPNC